MTIPFYYIYFFIYCYLLTFSAEFLNNHGHSEPSTALTGAVI